MNEERENEEKANPFADKAKEWPEEVMKRFKMQAERTGESVEQVIEAFLKLLEKEWGVDDWTKEDDDLLIDWSEQMVMQDRKSGSSGGGSDTVTFVGEWLGVEGTTRDRNTWALANATRKFQEDPNGAVSEGLVGHYYKQDGEWVINTKNEQIKTNEPDSEKPSVGVRVGSDWICLLWPSGAPRAPVNMGRYFYFRGNEMADFVNSGIIETWRVDMTGELRDLKIDIGRPVKIQVRKSKSKNPQWQDVLNVSWNFSDTMEYTDDWVDEDKRALLNPFKFWVQEDYASDLYAPLTELEEAYDAGKRTFDTSDGGEGTAGPLMVSKGIVTRMSTSGQESEYDETGRNYSLQISSPFLQDMYPKGNRSEVSCWVSGGCHDLTHPFSFRDIDDELWGYAERTSVLVFGRLKIRMQDGDRIPQFNVMGVYTDAQHARRRVGGGDTSEEQFD